MSNTLHVDVDALNYLINMMQIYHNETDSTLNTLQGAYHSFDQTFLSQDRPGFESRFLAFFGNLTNAKREADELLPLLRQLEQDAQTTEGVKF